MVADGHANWDENKFHRIKVHTNGAYRGLSCRVGAELATAYKQRQEWALVAVAHIRMQRETSSTVHLDAAEAA